MIVVFISAFQLLIYFQKSNRIKFWPKHQENRNLKIIQKDI